jgi:asparagine synthase (glutamine-hydrolysing)
MNEFLTKLDAITKSMCEKEMGVIYSGGVDSTILVELASKHCDVTAYTVGVGETSDVAFARQLKTKFNHEIIILSDDDVDAELDNILPTIKKTEGHLSPVRVGAEFPTYFAAKAAKEDGFKVMLSGQGPDEMFGGYARYLPVLSEQGYPALANLLHDDTLELKNDIIKIDMAVCGIHGIELREPMLADEFVEYGLSLPVEDKIYMSDKKPNYPHEEYEGKYVIRKFCEKKACEEIIPKEIVWRPKKAAQYGSGIHKVLDRLARKYGYKEKARNAGSKQYLTMFLEERFEAL